MHIDIHALSLPPSHVFSSSNQTNRNIGAGVERGYEKAKGGKRNVCAMPPLCHVFPRKKS